METRLVSATAAAHLCPPSVGPDSASTLATKTEEEKPSTYTRPLEPDRFNRLKRCIVQLQRAIKRLRPNKMYNWRPKEGPYSVKELSQAEDIILRSIKFNHFKQDIKTLKKLEGNDNQFQDRQSARKRNSIVKVNSNLHKLDPFIDNEGLLRVGGRLRSTTSPYGIEHPVIVPKKSHVTVLLIRQFHHGKQHHQGYGMTHNAIRQAGYYIINGRSAVSHVVAKCVTCRRLRPRPKDGGSTP